MARNETFDVQDDRFDDDDGRRPSRRREGMSTTAKILLGTLAVCGLSLVLCCGGLVWQGRKFVKNMENALTEDPVKVVEVQKSIIEMNVPPEFPPKNAMDMDLFGVMQMKMVMFGEGAEGTLMLMEMKMAGLSEEDMERQFKTQAAQHGGPDRPIDIESSETKTFTIDGKECRFVFAKGTRVKSDEAETADLESDDVTTLEEAMSDSVDQPEEAASPEGATPAESQPEGESTPELPAEQATDEGATDDHIEHVRQVTGMFPSKGGFAFLTLVIPEKHWNEDEVVQMIESMHK